MIYQKYLIFLSILLVVQTVKAFLYTNISIGLERFCQVSWINFNHKQNCVKIIGSSVPNCVHRAVFDMDIQFTTHKNYSIAPPLTSANRSSCQRYIQTSDDLDELKTIFNRREKFFYTFSRIYIINFVEKGKKAEFMFNPPEIQNIYKNVLYVYVIDARMSNSCIEFERIFNVLSGKELSLNNVVKEQVKVFYGNRLNHPLFNIKNPKNNLRVTFFNCSPYVMYFDDKFKNRKFV